jgi:hypothetical protein
MDAGLNHGRGKEYFSSPKCPDWFWHPPTSTFIWHQGSFLGVKQLEGEVKHSSPSTAKVEDKWSYTPQPPIRLNCIDRENYIKEIFYKALKWSISQKSITLSISINMEDKFLGLHKSGTGYQNDKNEMPGQ